MCELKVIFNGKAVMEDVVRIKVERNSIRLQSLLGESRTIAGKLIDINLIKQEAIIET